MHTRSLQVNVTPTQERKLQLALIVLWALLHATLFYIHGVRTTDDTQNYLDYTASILQQHELPNNYYLKYVGYPLFLALLFKLGIGLKGVVILQMLLSGFATKLFYKTTRHLSGNAIAPILATFILISWYDLQLFHAFILTESLYISLLLIAFYVLVKAKTAKQSLWVLPLLLYVALIRPNGFIAVVAYLGYLVAVVYQAAPSRKYKTVLLTLAVAIPVVAIIVVDQYLLKSFVIVETYEKGEVIYLYKGLLVHADKPIAMPPADASPLTKIYLFIHDNTSYFLRMSGWRFLLFWGNVKPFFSVLHNAVIVAVLYPMYFFAVRALFSRRIPVALSVFVILLILQQAFITTITSEDWMGRFLMSVVAFVFMFGAIGLSWQLQKWWAKYKPATKSASPVAP